MNPMMQQRFLFKKPIIGFIFLWMLQSSGFDSPKEGKPILSFDLAD
jgi:hypothetical protein